MLLFNFLLKKSVRGKILTVIVLLCNLHGMKYSQRFQYFREKLTSKQLFLFTHLWFLSLSPAIMKKNMAKNILAWNIKCIYYCTPLFYYDSVSLVHQSFPKLLLVLAVMFWNLMMTRKMDLCLRGLYPSTEWFLFQKGIGSESEAVNTCL